jgi:DNA adenine methylase
LLNRPPSPVETYNDLNGEAVNFFRVLKEDADGLVGLLRYTPYSRREFLAAKERGAPVSDMERARRFFVRTRQAFMAVGTKSNDGNWRHSIASNMPTVHLAALVWKNSLESLRRVSLRLRRVNLEHGPALDAIEKRDSPETRFYVDPPYIVETRTNRNQYEFELPTDDHGALAEALNRCAGKVALSAYEHGILDRLYPPPTWRKIRDRARPASWGGGAKRTEVLYVNYDPFSGRKRSRLF